MFSAIRLREMTLTTAVSHLARQRREVCAATALIVLQVSVASSVAVDLPLGKNVSSADRALVVKLESIDVKEIDASRDLDIAKIDLNGDGALDYVIVVNNQTYCGTGGCAASVYIAQNGQYRRVANMLAFGIALGDGSTKGVRDLVQQGRDGETRWVWDGSKYQQVLPPSSKK